VSLDPNAPAYPQGPKDRYGDPIRCEGMGLTVREAMAKDNMAAFLVGNPEPNVTHLAGVAVEAADALIAELNKTEGGAS
jgi:hypothetical protein